MYSLFLKFTKRVKSSLSSFIPFILLLLVVSNLHAANGLLGRYYNNINLTAPASLTRVDSTVDFNWGTGSPDGSINVDNFSVSWIGYIYIPSNASWTFYTQSDDGVKLTVNGSEIITNWTDHAPAENNATLTLAQGYYPIEMRFYEKGGGAVAQLKWSRPGLSKQIIPSSNLFTYPTINITDANLPEGNNSYSDMNFTITLSESANASVNYATSNGTATAGSDYNTTSGTLSFTVGGATSKTISVPIKGDTNLETNETFTVTLSNEINATLAKASATGTIINDDMGYCGTHALSNGFHVVNPFNDINKSIEIFCYNNRDFIALPIKNDSNNFVFNSNSLASTNYYNEAKNTATHFQAIEINAKTLDVIVDSSLRTPQAVGSFTIMGSSFSNINLTATPFAIDWDNTTISNCTPSKLRTAYYGQDVKINTLDYDNKAICNINTMKLKLLPDYHYLQYEGNEVLKKSCKTMAEAVPQNFLDATKVKGHYWISPSGSTRGTNATDITAAATRPIVAFCWYPSFSEGESKWVWTFLLAMDGAVTNKKGDLTGKKDSCSKFGLWPFVPNNERTFEKVRLFLYDKKPQWEKYTGTNNEKFKMFNNGVNYYLETEYNGVIWPYGSFGVYFPSAGDHTDANVSKEWGGNGDSDPGWMSGSPMHNLKSITIDYARLNDDDGNNSGVSNPNRDYYSWGINRSELDITDAQAAYSDTDTNRTDGSYPYEATMGAKGWVSILGTADLNKTNEWFISQTGAGVNFDHSKSQHPYYEPNGNYTAYAWLNFLYDSNGNVRHLDDLDAAYSYYDYMCMAEDNYDFYKQYNNLPGPFQVIEHGQTISNGLSINTFDTKLKTKIVKAPLNFDLILLDIVTASHIDKDQNISAGVYLSQQTRGASGDVLADLHYFGTVNGSHPDLNTSNGSLYLNSSLWPNGNNIISSAKQKVLFRFRYCNNTLMEWTDCWDNTQTPPVCKNSFCAIAGSDYFAVRPNDYSLTIAEAEPYRAGESYNVTFHAKDYVGSNTSEFNEPIPLTATETKLGAGCITGAYTPSPLNLSFSNGSKNIPDLSYGEVGVVNVKIKELSGSEFAVVDASDTDDLTRYITPYDQNWTYTPDHFEVNASMKNADFTYISADANFTMSLELDLNATAKAETNTTTKNYNTTCYANETNYIISHNDLSDPAPNDLNITPVGSLTRFRFSQTSPITADDINGTADLNQSLDFLDFNLSKDIFTTTGDKNGTSENIKVKINFDRNASRVVNPFILRIKDVNVTDSNIIKGAKSDTNATDMNRTFYYGRVYSTDYREQNPITATIRYEVYCNNDCNATAFPAIGAQSPTSLSWYTNRSHNSLADGNVTRFSSVLNTLVDGFNEAQSLAIATGLENHILSLPNGTIAPYTDRIQMTPSSWLIYNAFNPLALTNDFNVEFIRGGAWAGQGNLGQTVDVNASVRTNRKMEW